MDIAFIAFESLGVRSQATFIQTKDVNIFIDPSAALAPRRFGLPPHISEVKRLLELFDRIEELLRDSDVIIFTHYHYDHHDPGRFIDLELYRGKTIFLKDPHNNINLSQRLRALRLLKVLNEKAKAINMADGASTVLGGTAIRFSKPLPHGESSRLGYVVGVCVDDGDSAVLYTSDIEGGPMESHKSLLNFCRASIAVIDGPPTYLLGYRYSENSLRLSKEFITKLIGVETMDLVIIDHHVCRDIDYSRKLIDVFERARSMGKKVKTAAEAMGLQPLFLEAMRRELYRERPENGLKLLKSVYRDVDDVENIFGDK